jgi:TonB family protein
MPHSENDNTAAANSDAGRSPATHRLIAATRDPALGRALQALAGEMSVVIVDSLQKLTDEMLRHGSNLALLDSGVADEQPLEAVVDALTSQFPNLRLVVAGHASEQNLLTSRLANEAVFRFAHKPASPQRLQLFLEAAARDSGRRRGPVAQAAAPRPPSKMAFAMAGLVAVVVAVAAAWMFWPKGAAARLNARDLGRVEEMLRQASTAMNGGRFVAFDGSSAAELYRDVLQLDKASEPAQAGLDKAINGAIGHARQALGEGKLESARNDLEAVRVIAPGHAGLKDLATLIDAENVRQLADDKARQALAERQAQISAAVEKTQARIQSGALLDPAADSAVTYFHAAQELSPGDPVVRAARAELTAALVAAGERAVVARRLPEARRHANAAGRINSSAPGLDALVLHIDEAGAPSLAGNNIAPAATRPAPPVAPVTEPVATTPAPIVAAPPAPATAAETPATTAPQVATATPAAPAVAAWVPGEGVIGSNKLKVLRSVLPEFPRGARESGTSGWVDLEYTVAKDGAVKELSVTTSEPRRIFDNAAMDALRRYRYAPILKDGQPVEQRVRTRIRFTATDVR